MYVNKCVLCQSYYRDNPPREFSRTFLADSICYNACNMAKLARASAIITFTHSGYTAIQIASHRPDVNIFAFTDNRRLLRKLSVVWGVRTFYSEAYENIDDYIKHSINTLLELKLIQDEDVIVHVGSTPILERGRTNMIKLSYV